ncbi:RDD family protein [Georgenia sp. MJ173]|uniref:RDD family protein n=1 Tax=Georgenia sunbinii TaxID=3117728 RepID=UPI002F2677A3
MNDVPAPWAARVFGTWIDLFVVGLPALVPVAFAMVTAEPSDIYGDDASHLTPAGVAAAWLAVVVYLALWSWNRYARQAREGQTVGKRRLGTRVVDAGTGDVPSGRRLLARDVAHVLDVLPLCLGLLWPIGDRRGQTFADKLTGTVVVPA